MCTQVFNPVIYVPKYLFSKCMMSQQVQTEVNS